MRLFLVFCILFIPSFALAESGANDIDMIVDEYMEAYKSFDVDRVETLISEDFDFHDPTSEALPEPFITSGRDNVLRKWSAYRATVDEHRFIYEVERRFSYSGHVVLIGQAGWHVVADGQLSQSMMPIVTIITVRDGMVVAHRDYVDYATGFAAATLTPVENED